MSIVPNYGTSTLLASTFLDGLADDAFWNSERLDFSGATLQPVVTQIHVTLLTVVAAGSSNGFAEVWLAEGLSTAGLSGGVGSTQGIFAGTPTDSEAIQNALMLGIIAMPAEDTIARTYQSDFLLPSFVTPKFGAVVVHNRSGAALSTASNEVSILATQVNNT